MEEFQVSRFTDFKVYYDGIPLRIIDGEILYENDEVVFDFCFLAENYNKLSTKKEITLEKNGEKLGIFSINRIKIKLEPNELAIVYIHSSRAVNKIE